MFKTMDENADNVISFDGVGASFFSKTNLILLFIAQSTSPRQRRRTRLPAKRRCAAEIFSVPFSSALLTFWCLCAAPLRSEENSFWRN